MAHSRPHRTDAAERAGGAVERMLDAAREMLGMDVAFVAQFADERVVLRELGGDAESFGLKREADVPLNGTDWLRLAEDRRPSVIPAAGDDERVGNLDVRDFGTRRASAPSSACPCGSRTIASTEYCAPSAAPPIPRSRSATPGS